jgi:hypothetical protein
MQMATALFPATSYTEERKSCSLSLSKGGLVSLSSCIEKVMLWNWSQCLWDLYNWQAARHPTGPPNEQDRLVRVKQEYAQNTLRNRLKSTPYTVLVICSRDDDLEQKAELAVISKELNKQPADFWENDTARRYSLLIVTSMDQARQYHAELLNGAAMPAVVHIISHGNTSRNFFLDEDSDADQPMESSGNRLLTCLARLARILCSIAAMAGSARHLRWHSCRCRLQALHAGAPVPKTLSALSSRAASFKSCAARVAILRRLLTRCCLL